MNQPATEKAARSYPLRLSLVVFCLTAFRLIIVDAALCTVQVSPPTPASTNRFKMGESRRPDGATLTVNSQSLVLNGKSWTPVMGEFHFSRYPESEWRQELLKMKAGGVDIVATYVFWIHHEEVEGAFDWSGRRNLRRFVQLCGDAALKVIVRCGPWCHGEVRNGGQPDWLLNKGWKLRSDDPAYLEKTRILYAEIAQQLSGILWKDGGPVIGAQFENEYWGPPAHLLSLKRIAREVGLDLPLYTRTGWPGLMSPMPFGEILPLYGVYAEGFWDREITPMPGQYWAGFHFSLLRTDANIANELLGRRDAKDADDIALYPYLTCEIGGGMMNSYHRRIRVYPADIESTTLVKLGSGSTSPGYYMYHGGVNPEGKLTTLQESQATGYWNDLPLKNYDFQAPIGQYGQIRPQYHSLRRLHLFLHEWGSVMARMPAALPDVRPKGRDDTETLRWCVRSDGHGGFVFVNNYERLKELPPKNGVQFEIRLPATTLSFPDTPVRVPADACFFWPFSLDLGPAVKLSWATAQPITAIDHAGVRTVFFAETPGVPARFSFPSAINMKLTFGTATRVNGKTIATLKPSRSPGLILNPADGGTVQIVLLDQKDSLALWKAPWLGVERVFITSAGLAIDGENLQLTSTNQHGATLSVYPPPAGALLNGKEVASRDDGLFRQFATRLQESGMSQPTFELIRVAGPAREIPMGKIKQAVAAAPEDEDFTRAAVWRIKLPDTFRTRTNALLRFSYVGDVARVSLNGKLVTDDFYNGKPLEIGLWRHAPEILDGELTLAVLPLRKNAPIYLAREARPTFAGKESIVTLESVELLPVQAFECTEPSR